MVFIYLSLNLMTLTAIPHANVPKENELFTIRIIAKKGRCKALQTLIDALVFCITHYLLICIPARSFFDLVGIKKPFQ